MIPEADIQEKRDTPPRIGDFGTRVNAKGKLEVYWYVENALMVEIEGIVNPTEDLDASCELSISGPTPLRLIARNETRQLEMSITAQPLIGFSNLKIPELKEGLTLHTLPDGSSHGFLLEEGSLQFPKGAIKQTEPGTCPQCEKKAKKWEPPVGDRKYDDVYRIYKQRLGDKATDDDIHAEFLRRTGGYVSICDCGISFFVPVK